MARCIVFDLGGVLIDLDRGRCIRAFREILGYERIVELLDPCHQKGIYGDMEAGILSADDFRREVLRESRPGALPGDVDRCMAAFLTGMDPAKVDLLKRLSERYPLYCLSNNNEISVVRMYEIFDQNGLDWKRIFRKEFISSRMKLLKPSPEIFLEATREMGLPPEEILFVDDAPDNVEGARSVGWEAVLYTPGTSLEACITPYL